MSNQHSIDLYSTISKAFEKLAKDFDKLYPKNTEQIIIKKDGVTITINYKDFKKKKDGKRK